MIHTGGTLGMDPAKGFPDGLAADSYLDSLEDRIPELGHLAEIESVVPFNRDSSTLGPADWLELCRLLDQRRERYDAFVMVHGTDTMAYTASALSLCLRGFGKAVVLTGSQLPLRATRTDARENLINSVSCAVSGELREVAICFDSLLLRGNRARKVQSSALQAFRSPGFPPLARFGVRIEWGGRGGFCTPGTYEPRFLLDSRVIRIPVVPGVDPRVAYGHLFERGIRGAVLEAFGAGNVPNLEGQGWLDWVAEESRAGLRFLLSTQCEQGPIFPGLYQSGQDLLDRGVETAARMTPECSVVKLMLCLANEELRLDTELAGEFDPA